MSNSRPWGDHSPRHLTTSHSPKKPSPGFTLLELIVVISIIGILIAFASLSVSTSGGKQLETEAKRFYSLMKLAGEEAIMNTQELALELDRNKYQFLVWSDTGFKPIAAEGDNNFFRPRELPEYISMNVEIEGIKIDFDDYEKDDEQPKIGLFSSGELTPFSIYFLQDEDLIYHITGDYNGKIDYLGSVKEKPF